MCAMQRSSFVLNCGINRPGDPVDTIVPSPARQMPKAGDVGGAQSLVTFDAIGGGSSYRVLLEGTNMLDPAVPIDPNNPTVDPNALWIPAAIPSQAVSGTSPSPSSLMVEPTSQQVTLLPFVFVRATVLPVGSSPVSDADNLDINVNVKLDYITG